MMSDSAISTRAADALRETAARWHEQMMLEPVAAEVRAAFARWMEQSSEHRHAYEAVKSAWELAQRGAHDPQMLALRHETALRITRRSVGPMRRSHWAIAAVLCICIGTVLVAAVTPQFAPRMNAVLASLGIPANGRYVTDVGERLVVNLKDGSQVTLNTSSALQVAFTAGERRLVLTRGQALFEVAKDPSRPFVVETNGRRIIAVGTAFDVRVEGKRVQVTMLEGVVRVERSIDRNDTAQGRSDDQAELAARLIATLAAGEQLTVNDLRLDRIRVTDPERETSWRRGQLLFENTRLADALAEVNRYSETQIELADPALAELRISGAFSTGRPLVFVEALTTYFPIDVVEKSDRLLALSERDSSAARK